MDRRSWPWKRKSKNSAGAVMSAPVAVSANASPANRSSRRHDDHGMSKFLADQVQEATLRWQEAEERVRSLNAKLAAAEAELAEKENHVKQHAKVAEEAVTGWERAEEETASVKLQLETLSRRKDELDSKVAALESAVKEAARSQQRAREDHERRMQDAIARKNKECDRIRNELDARVAELGHRLLEAAAENKVLAATLHERMSDLADAGEARSKAEAEIAVLEARLESADKRGMSLQYEIQVLSKQLQIRDDEKDYCKREVEAALKHQQESARKIQLLDGECQRLRSLVRRKLPGPATMAQMKQEVDTWGREERRRSFGKDRDRDRERLSGGSKDFQIQLLTERVLSMEEETKLLREVLAQKNMELAAARSLSEVEVSAAASAVSATSVARGGLKPRALLLSGGSVSEPSVNDDHQGGGGGGGSCADAWASAMISELDQFKKDGKSDRGSPRIILEGDEKFQMMDDFAEMEELTSSASKPEDRDRVAELERMLGEKEEQLNAANRLCMEISSKLLATEKELSALQAKNAANEGSLIKLQERLDLLLEAPAGKVADNEKKVETQAALTANVQRVVCLVEALAHAVAEHDETNSLPSPSQASTTLGSDVSSSEHSSSSSSSPVVNLSVEKLAAASNRVAEGKLHLTDFMGELSTVLNLIVSSDNGSEKWRRKEHENGGDTFERLQAEAKKLREELNRIKVEKDLLHQSCEKSKERLHDVEPKLASAERLVSDLKQQLASTRSEFSLCRANLEERIKVADATVAELQGKLESVEGKFQAERDQQRELGTRYEELEKQLNLEKHYPDDYLHGENDNGEEIAEKLAECQKTILALGKQLKILSADSDNKPVDAEESCVVRTLQSDHTLEERDDDLSWSRIKLQGFEPDHLTLPWSPPRSVEDLQPPSSRKNNARSEESDSTWLYSGDHAAAGYRRTVMRSPGRYVTKKTGATGIKGSKEIKNQGGSSFTRFFSRNSRS